MGQMMVPGPSDEPVSVVGKVLDRDKFTGILKEYYRLRECDEETGLTLKEALSALGLNDLFKTE